MRRFKDPTRDYQRWCLTLGVLTHWDARGGQWFPGVGGDGETSSNAGLVPAEMKPLVRGSAQLSPCGSEPPQFPRSSQPHRAVPPAPSGRGLLPPSPAGASAHPRCGAALLAARALLPSAPRSPALPRPCPVREAPHGTSSQSAGRPPRPRPPEPAARPRPALTAVAGAGCAPPPADSQGAVRAPAAGGAGPGEEGRGGAGRAAAPPPLRAAPSPSPRCWRRRGRARS